MTRLPAILAVAAIAGLAACDPTRGDDDGAVVTPPEIEGCVLHGNTTWFHLFAPGSTANRCIVLVVSKNGAAYSQPLPGGATTGPGFTIASGSEVEMSCADVRVGGRTGAGSVVTRVEGSLKIELVGYDVWRAAVGLELELQGGARWRVDASVEEITSC